MAKKIRSDDYDDYCPPEIIGFGSVHTGGGEDDEPTVLDAHGVPLSSPRGKIGFEMRHRQVEKSSRRRKR